MNVLFIANGANPTPYSEFIPLGKFLQQKGCSVSLLTDKGLREDIRRKVYDSDIGLYINGTEKNNTKTQNDSQQGSANNVAKRRDKSTKKERLKTRFAPFTRLYAFIKMLRWIRSSSRIARTAFDAIKPSVVIVYGDRSKGLVPASLKVARERDVKIIDLQVALNNDEFLYRTHRQNNPNFSAFKGLNRLIGLIKSRHVKTFGSESVVFYPWYMFFPLMLANMLPKNPWVLGGSWADRFLCIDESSRQEFIKGGGQREKVRVVGQFSHDFLHKSFTNKEELKQKLLQKYFSTTDEKIFVLALPQLYEHSILAYEEALEEIRYLVESLSKTGVNILVSLHPKMEVSTYRFIEEYERIKIAEERLFDILPAANVYISAFESTITWALLCRIPSIHLNYYGLGLDLSQYSGCVVLDKKMELLSLLKRFVLTNDSQTFFDDGKQYRQLPPFQGKSGETIFEALKMVE